MIISLVQPPARRLSWRDHGGVEGVLGGVIRHVAGERADRLVRLVTAVTLTWSLFLLARVIGWIVLQPWPHPKLAEIIGFAVCGLVSLFLIRRGIRNDGSRPCRWLLAGLALVIFGLLPFADVWWAPILAMLAALGLVFIRPPWSAVLYAVCLVTSVLQAFLLASLPVSPIGLHLYRYEFASYDAMVIGWTGLALAVLVWLARIIRELEAAREQLAVRAVAVERRRIDDELARTLGAALELIIADGQAAGRLVRTDPAAAATELSRITARSRTSLADARNVLTGYRAVSLEAELRAATTLLAAAGIRVAVVLPDGELPPALAEPLRARLRACVARTLSDGAVRECVLTLSRDGHGQLDVELTSSHVLAGEHAA